jgi:hypothetical protein
MKNINVKSVMIFTLLIASAMATPVMAAGYGNDDDKYEFDQVPGIGSPGDLLRVFGGFGSMFSGLGYGGQILGQVFGMLLMQTLSNFSESEVMPGVYVLSAFQENTVNFTRDFSKSGEPTYEYYMPPRDYNQSLVKDIGYAYCEVKKEGMANVTVTIGGGVTLLIYDHDKSFIPAIQKVIDFINQLRSMNLNSLTDEEQNQLIHDGVEVLTWFLIHINDIFTGDELFAVNPITWQKMNIKPLPGFSLTKTWRVTGNNYKVEGPSDSNLTAAIGDSNATILLNNWNTTARDRNDSYMEWLLRSTDDVSLANNYFTAFTFDLVQLWVKNFEIHIDAGALVDLISGSGSNSSINVADVFRGLDIDFYLFTHHLGGAFLYNDSNHDGTVSSSYSNLTIDGYPVKINDTQVQVPDHSEITHRIMLGNVSNFAFELPHKTGANKISWGLTLNDPTVVPVPIGVDLNSYLGAKPENLQYIHFGFSFEPREVAAGILYAPIKLDQFFSPWNGGTGSSNHIEDLNLAIIYLSTMLHFHLNVATLGENPEDPTALLNPADDYNNQTHTLMVGNYLGKAFKDKLAFVDIAGENYQYGAEDEASRETAKANSSIIPLALYQGEVERHDTFVSPDTSQVLTFATDIRLNVSLNVMAYAVCFPKFNNGNGIWHDPTFSVYMVFEAQGFWALILLIAGVGLVGIATILIKRRKDARF